MELQILDMIQKMRSPLLDSLMIRITSLANAGIIWIALTVILLLIPKTRRVGIILALALVIDAIICNIMIKPLVARIRPYDVNTAIQLIIPKQVDYSFPSGHTAASFACATGLYLGKQKKLAILSFVLAGLIAFSRMYLYVHYPTDVLAGMVIGIICGYVAYRIILIREKSKNEKKEAIL